MLRWKPLQVKSVIQRTMKEFMEAKSYDQNEVASWTKELATNIRNQLKGISICQEKVSSVHVPPHSTRVPKIQTSGTGSNWREPRRRCQVSHFSTQNKTKLITQQHRMGCRCLWDSETDRVAEETLVTVSWLPLFLFPLERSRKSD